MRSFLPALPLLIPALLIAADSPIPEAAKPKLLMRISVCGGDPLGSLETQTLKIFAEPNLLIQENREFRFLSGGEIPTEWDGMTKRSCAFGIRVWGAAGAIQKENVSLDISAEVKQSVDPRKGRVSIRSIGAQVVGMFKLGERVRIPLDNGSGPSRTWMEIQVEPAGL
jgi:hypothetical protein